MIKKKPIYHKRMHNERNIDSERSEAATKSRNKDIISRIAIVISIAAFILSVVNFYMDKISAGQLVVYQPTGFCIVRGYKDIGFPSDHLVIPLTLENTGKGVKTLQTPVLKIEESHSGLEYVYRMTGTIPDLYGVTLDQSYQLGFSVSVPEHAVKEYYIVFNVENWWDLSKPEYHDFHFQGKQEWKVSLSYLMNGKEVTWRKGTNKNLFTMPIYETVDNLKYGEGYNSDCFSTVYGFNTPGN